MQLAMIGLGKMGGNMSARLLRAGHSVVVHDRDPATIARYAGQRLIGATSNAPSARPWAGQMKREARACIGMLAA